ncbi:phosphoglucomutase (alpha-D-glucose-1,6-bisphosphate-dependent) [Aquiluna sp. KACHI24]|uniref:phosphoglucomutase (alpha-D-glucose-1,6-bisphosphate-dependent) n=1 Tax=Aquiluna sp. KACHI24 TaxID=2968831 RepID=UPI00220EB556|nr:phosphoglucomutase (alpha-D-glucose-1,6-bisphosphate-dependent) [Aquiluna sp. KACHI24]BDP99712.1 phosphoglucomutase, alpha-D-glucose phosphate-specific [Aquiluna sp. KACHI24]
MHPRAGQPAQAQDLINVSKLVSNYVDLVPDVSVPEQKVSFGTSGHRGSANSISFNEQHILAITQAIVEYRRSQGITGPIYVGRDTHALSEPAQQSVLEVLAGNEVEALVDASGGYTPTPAVSVAIIDHNRNTSSLADGIVITPSHNPPADGGIKYNPPHGGPADSDATSVIAKRANELIANSLKEVKRAAAKSKPFDYREHYISQLNNVLNMEAIAASSVSIGADPMGGASVHYWGEIADRYNLNLTVVNPEVDYQFGFMTLDWDGKIRMDCSSPHSMASLIQNRTRYDISTGNDADADRHGIVTRDHGLMNPNHFLAVSIDYLFQNRPQWSSSAAVGKTMVSSSMINRVVNRLGRELLEVPVGFKWFVPGLSNGSLGFGGEESAGGSFLRRNGQAWSTDKDGLILCLLAAEIQATSGKSPSEHYQRLTQEFGAPSYKRVDAPASLEQKARLAQLTEADVTASKLAGESITAVEAKASSGGALGGIKVSTASAWFAARPSGTENVYKIYGESFQGDSHLDQVLSEAQLLVDSVVTAK